MKNRMTVFLVATLLTSVALLASVAIGQNSDAPSQGTFAKDSDLHELAKLKGGRFVTTEASLDGFIDFPDLKSIARASKIVVVGTARENVSKLSQHGRSISTVYEFQVEDSVKGKYHVGDVLSVALPGGRVTFEDGTVAQVNVAGLRKLLNGNRYLLFLVPRPEENDLYVLTGGSRGLFELQPDGSVEPGALRGRHALSVFSGSKEREFVATVRDTVKSQEK
jgi:hypothetical protein